MDLWVSKMWAIKLATEAARTVLSVDQIIVARQAGDPRCLERLSLATGTRMIRFH